MASLLPLSRRLLLRHTPAASILSPPLRLLPRPLAAIRHASTSPSQTTQTPLPPLLRPANPPPAPSTTASDPPIDLTTLQTYHTALRHQPPFYTTIHIHNRCYLVTLGDRITLPAVLYPPRNPANPLNKPLAPGDTIKLTHASVLGSREYTIKGTPFIDPRLFTCRAVVVEVTAEPMRKKEKTKRRQRRVKTVRSKHRYTVLRISELAVNELPVEFTAAGGAAGPEITKVVKEG
ncbi:hypothetical protein TWF696_001878 [Orbilia brochopaga]|uniref:Large ribosomal subunit protein bL21m n=1 Tax=Orbilia brochopaga TaxID=3140254 RepID=A0AAV9U6U3_9PEZI